MPSTASVAGPQGTYDRGGHGAGHDRLTTPDRFHAVQACRVESQFARAGGMRRRERAGTPVGDHGARIAIDEPDAAVDDLGDGDVPVDRDVLQQQPGLVER